jgi:hypothetical protein
VRWTEVEQEGGDHQEDHRQDRAHGLHLAHLVGHEPGRHLEPAGDGAQTAVALEQPVDVGDDRLGRSARSQRERDVVETALHVEGRGEGAASHPEDAESAIVGQQVTRRDGVDVLRRQGDADDHELPLSAVDDRPDRVAGLESMGRGEGLDHQDLVWARGLDIAPPEQVDVVEDRAPALGNRQQQPARRLDHARHVQRHLDHHPRLDLGHPRNRLEPRHRRQRRALERSEDVGQAIAVVVGPVGVIQRLEGRGVHGEHRYPGGDHQADGQRLALEPREVAQELAVEGQHGLTTRARWR